MFYRIAQVEQIQDTQKKYDGWRQVMAAAVVISNFTENGWGLTRAPQHLIEKLKTSLHNGLLSTTAYEEDGEVIDFGDQPPLFIDQLELNEQVLEELKPLHEEWSGVSLTGALAYGLRVYRNNSVLSMHVDRPGTHIISCILHVDSSQDAEPWPIFMEDFQGNTNEVILTSGDMLFYESSKCFHGRPRPFKGSWYSSLFVHYYPTDWDPEQAELEISYSLPPTWDRMVLENPGLVKLDMNGTSMHEPECPDRWCGTVDTIKWCGPAKKGVVITTGYTEVEDAEL
jgi:hypothetical protein